MTPNHVKVCPDRSVPDGLAIGDRLVVWIFFHWLRVLLARLLVPRSNLPAAHLSDQHRRLDTCKSAYLAKNSWGAAVGPCCGNLVYLPFIGIKRL